MYDTAGNTGTRTIDAPQQYSDDEVETLRTEVARLQGKVDDYEKYLSQAAQVCSAAATGDLEARCLHIPTGSNIEIMMKSINHMLDLTDAFVREAGASLQHASDEKFYRRVLLRGLHGSFKIGAGVINKATEQMAERTEQLKQARADRLALADEFETAIKNIAQNVAAASTEASATARTLVDTTEITSQQSGQNSESAQSASDSLSNVAVATEEVAVTVAEIDRQVQESGDIARRAVEEADKTNAIVSFLLEASNEITRVINLINQVARQTRLLALNATIEAARAGEVGKGFAVVASEVKDLASQTAGATKEIEEKVQAIQEATKEVVTAISGISNTVNNLSHISGVVANAMKEQRSATDEISSNIQQAALGTKQVTENVVHLAEATVETNTAASQMLEASSELSQLAESLTTKVDLFLVKVRA